MASNQRAPLGAAAGQFFGFLAVAIVNAAALTTTPVARNGLWLRMAHQAYDLGYALALGLTSAGLVAAYLALRKRFAPRLASRRAALLDLAAIALVSLALGSFVLGEDLENLASRVAEQRGLSDVALRRALVASVSMGIPAVALLAWMLARPWLRWAGVALGILVAAANHLVLTQDYPGAHLYLAWAGAILIGSQLSTFHLLNREVRPGARWVSTAYVVLLAAFAGWSVVSAPSSTLRVEMLSERGSMLTPFLARLQANAAAPSRKARIPPEQAAWFVDRTRAPDVPPTDTQPTHDAIVIVLTFDSMRADVVQSEKCDSSIPEIVKMRQEGVHFTMARSPGSQTIYTLSTVFAGKYFSQMYWTPHPPSGTWPWQDESVRFPKLLANAGVPSVTFASRNWLVGEYGIVRGFSEETVVEPETTREKPPEAKDLTDPLLARIAAHTGGPLFAFVHYMDSHFPFLTEKGGTAPERYLRALSNCDAQIARIRKAVEDKGLTARTTLFVSADHGEAFGEHGVTMHGENLYEEQIRVPLLVVGPRVVPHAEETPVSLIDLGPTILDLFGLPTPGNYMGQSIAPLLRGESAHLTRPIVAEGRLRQTMILSNGTKLIRNQRQGTMEMYDLRRDPDEKDNLIEARAGADQMALLETFFEAHLLRARGYKPPYRR